MARKSSSLVTTLVNCMFSRRKPMMSGIAIVPRPSATMGRSRSKIVGNTASSWSALSFRNSAFVTSTSIVSASRPRICGSMAGLPSPSITKSRLRPTSRLSVIVKARTYRSKMKA
jgi:hypothetical protein